LLIYLKNIYQRGRMALKVLVLLCFVNFLFETGNFDRKMIFKQLEFLI
jgi:hypothetical protein